MTNISTKQWQNSVAPRHRPYSSNSSIRSVIHGPNIEDIEEQLRMLEMNDRFSEKYRSTPSNVDKIPFSNLSTRAASQSDFFRSSNAVPIQYDSAKFSTSEEKVRKRPAKLRQPRPKTCIASFPVRKSDPSHPSRSISSSASDLDISKAKRFSSAKDNGYHAPIREAEEEESLAQRHEWAIRTADRFLEHDADSQLSNLLPKKKFRPRHSASAPPGKSSSLKASFNLGNLSKGRRCQSAREVEAFTPASRMKNTVVLGPKKLNVFQPRPSPPTIFRMMYDRGDVPCTLHHDYKGQSLRWKVDVEKLDYHQFLPLFFDGLRETRHPYDFFSRAGVRELLSKGGEKVVPVIPQLILPIKKALDTRIPAVICTVLKVIQELVHSAPGAGEALVPYYRQLLPTLNLFQHRNVNCGDEIDYSQQRRENLGDLIQETLELLERNGGKDAYVNIKYMVPTYQSCLNN